MTDTTLESAAPRPATVAAVELIDVVKCFGAGSSEVRALNGVSLRIEQRELVAVMGPSGCGKSTMLHLAGAMEQPTAGRVLVHGHDIAGLTPTEQATLRRTEVGFVFQRLNLLPSLSALENVALPLELDGVGVRAAREQARAALAAVGLDTAARHLDRFPDDFSGGEQQRIAIARAIASSVGAAGDSRRRVILADEPTGSLDTVTADGVIELLASLPARFRTTVVLVTHEPRFASWADRVVFLRDGRIVDQTRSLHDDPRAGADRGAA